MLGEERYVTAAKALGTELSSVDDATLARYGPGYMTGLSGIGRFFLRLADPENVPAVMTVLRSGR
jgi:hypothetical protein